MKASRSYRSLFILFFLAVFVFVSRGQTTHLSNSGIYDFLDELAEEQIIEQSSLAAPFSCKYIAKELYVADSLREQLTSRQQKELDFYLSDYCTELPTTDNDHQTKVNLQPGTYWLWKKHGSNKRFDIFYYSDSSFQYHKSNSGT